MVGLKENIYVTFTCKNCKKAFMDIDKDNSINEVPLTNRYCPECVAKGFTNKNKKVDVVAQRFKELIEEYGYTEKRDISFLKKEYNRYYKWKQKSGQRIDLRYIFKQAVEVLGYQEWKS